MSSVAWGNFDARNPKLKAKKPESFIQTLQYQINWVQQSRKGRFREMSRKFPQNFPIFYGFVPETFWNMSVFFPGNLRNMVHNPCKHLTKSPWTTPYKLRNIPDIFRKSSGKFPEHFRTISEKFQDKSGTFPETFRKHSGTFPEIFRASFEFLFSGGVSRGEFRTHLVSFRTVFAQSWNFYEFPRHFQEFLRHL